MRLKAFTELPEQIEANKQLEETNKELKRQIKTQNMEVKELRSSFADLKQSLSQTQMELEDFQCQNLAKKDELCRLREESIQFTNMIKQMIDVLRFPDLADRFKRLYTRDLSEKAKTRDYENAGKDENEE